MKTTTQIANEVLDAMLAKAKAYQVRRAVDGSAECRDWASWENPEDTPEDEEEDYDWQVLSLQSGNTLSEIWAMFKGKYPNHDIQIFTEEKNWISIKVSEKE